MMRYIIILLLFSSTLAAQTKLRQIERSATKWHVPAAWDSIPGVTGHAMKYIDLETLMDTVGIQQFGIDSLDYRNDSLLIWVGGGYYFAIIPQGLMGTGDDGSVAYWHQDTIAGDTAHYWDRTNKRLGLNTKTPSSLLHVKKNEYALPVAEFDNPGTNGQTVLIKHGASFDGRYPLKIETPAATSYFDARGYLGLGVSPSYPLHVKNASGISRFENTNTNGDAGFDLYHASKQWRIAMNAEGGTTNNVHFRDVTGSRYPITLQSSNGYVGILNLTPARELHVTGRVRVSTLDSDLTPPTTAGPTKMVITDESGDLSFANIPSGGGPDSTNIVGGWGIESIESPANTFNLIADSTQVASQYDLTLKQDKLTLTTIGTSGAATLVGSTLNVPQYQSVLTNPVTGTGTTNRVSKFTGTSTIGNSQLYDDGSTVGIGALNSSYKFYVNSGNMKLGDNVVANSLNKLYFGDGTFVYVGEGGADDRLYLRGSTLAVDINGSTGTAGQVLTSSGSGTASWQNPASGSGTVTSVAIANGGGISVSGSPITTSGTITLTAADLSNTNEIQTLSYNSGTRDLSISSGNTVTIPLTGTAAPGLAPTRPLTNQTSVFLRGDNTWTTPPTGGGVTNLAYGTPATSAIYGYYVPLDPSTGGSPGVAVNLYADDGMEVKKGASNFAGYKLNQSYGNLIRTTNTGVAITSTETNVDFTGGFENGNVTYSTVNDNITLSQAGTYEVEFCTTIYTTGTTNRRVKFRLFNSTTAFPDIIEIINDIAADKYQEVSRTRIFNATAGATISIKVSYDNAIGSGTDVLYRFPSLKIKRLK